MTHLPSIPSDIVTFGHLLVVDPASSPHMLPHPPSRILFNPRVTMKAYTLLNRRSAWLGPAGLLGRRWVKFAKAASTSLLAHLRRDVETQSTKRAERGARLRSLPFQYELKVLTN